MSKTLTDTELQKYPDFNPHFVNCEASVLVSVAVAQQRNLADFTNSIDFIALATSPGRLVPSLKVGANLPNLAQGFDLAKFTNGPTGDPLARLTDQSSSDDLAVSDLADASATVPVLTLSVPDDDELRELQASRQDTSGTLKYLQNNKEGPKGLMKLDKYVDELEIRHGLLVHVDKSNPDYVGKVIPRSAWPRVLHYFHSGPTAKHLGAAKILDRMRQSVWWPSMEADVNRLCRSCVLCLNKRSTTPPHVRPLQPVVSEYPNHIVAMDLFGPFLPTRRGNCYVEVATDLFTKYVNIRPTPSAKPRTRPSPCANGSQEMVR